MTLVPLREKRTQLGFLTTPPPSHRRPHSPWGRGEGEGGSSFSFLTVASNTRRGRCSESRRPEILTLNCIALKLPPCIAQHPKGTF